MIPPVERRDLETLLLCCLAIPLAWLALFGWTPSQSAGSDDQLALFFPLIEDFIRTTRGDWTKFAYRPDILGGVKIHDVLGTMPFFQFCGWLGLPTLVALNGVTFFTQALYAFLGVRIAGDVTRIWSSSTVAAAGPALGWFDRLGIILLTALAPAVGWRMTTGHFALVLESLLWVSLFALLLAARNRSETYMLTAVAILVQIQAFPTTGQMHVYGLVFDGFLLLAVALPLRPWRKLLVPAYVVLGSALVSLPKLAGMFWHATSTDASRSIGGASVIYSYATGTFQDWISSIAWGLELITTGREQSRLHEFNFAFGPLILLLALIPWRRTKWVGAGLAVGFLLPVLFSVDFPGVATVLTTLVPPIRSYRVPERSILVFALLLPALASGALLSRLTPVDRHRWPLVLVALLAGFDVFLISPSVREIIVWTVTAAFVLDSIVNWRLRTRVPAACALLFLGFSSAGAFKERLMPFANEDTLVQTPSIASRDLLDQQPTLGGPIERLMIDFGLNEFNSNSAYAMRISSLNGYLSPPYRFLALEAALAGAKEDRLRNSYQFDQTSRSFQVLRQLYNVRVAATVRDNQIGIDPIGATAGPAWFSRSIVRIDSLPELAGALAEPGDGLATLAHETMWIVRTDQAVEEAGPPPTVTSECMGSQVIAVNAARGEQVVRVRVRNDGVCPLTLAMNYAVNLQAHSGSTALAVFPAYGALAAMMVPAGATEVVVEAEAYVPAWSELGWFVGVILIGLAFWEIRGTRSREVSAA